MTAGLNVEFLISLERELYIFLSLVGGDAAYRVIRAAADEYGNPECRCYQLKNSFKYLPLLLQQLGRLLAPPLLRLGGQPAFLAAGYLKQSGVQTAISVGALITAIALFTALVVMIHSFRGTVAMWVQQSIAGDLYIRPRLDALNQHRQATKAK